MHSATKYISGHSDMVGGMLVVGDNAGLAEKLTFLQNAVGAIAGPFDSFLALRGVKTLALRMQRHCENALQLAQWLQAHPKIARVRSEEHTSELQSLMRISYAVFCLKKKKTQHTNKKQANIQT